MLSKKYASIASFAATLAILLPASPVLAQGASAGSDKPYTDARRLGTSTAFNKVPLTDAASIKRMAERRGIDSDIRKLLYESGLSETAEAVLATLATATSSFKGGRCSDMKPQDGVIVECEFQTGATIEWMAHRPNVSKGDRVADRLIRLRWAGKPFAAFLFRVTTADKAYTFMLPKLCGNLSLVSEEAAAPRTGFTPIGSSTDTSASPVVTPPPVAPPPAPAPAPTATPVPAPTPVPPVPTLTPVPAVSTPTAQPLLPPVTAPDTASMPVLDAPRQNVKSFGFFVDALGGKDRRVRPIEGRTTVNGSLVAANAGAANFAQCSPLLGVKFGVAKRWDNDWELAGAAGVAFSVVTQNNKVREHELLADVEINKYVGARNILVGTGLSLWDITHRDTFTPAWMVHLGVPLKTERVYLMGEGRLFFKQLDDIANNYQVWAGVRIRF